MKLSLPSVSLFGDLATAIEGAQDGVLLLTDLPAAPLAEVRSVFDSFSTAEGQDVAQRLNRAYPKNLVYKDSYASGNGGPNVDMKRVLDLSPERIECIERVDPNVVSLARTGPLGKTMMFWDSLRNQIVPTLLAAVAGAVGSDDVVTDASLNYRMVDYYPRPASSVAPRCGEHRDFGSFTLIFPGSPGLEIFTGGEWRQIDAVPEGNAILMFGWCTQIRSNGRLPAALHRVGDCAPGDDGTIPRRTSAVLFVAPKSTETALEPVVRKGEEARYISGIKVGMLRGKMARKWRNREGTLSAEDKILEEEEILATNMKTQDDVVRKTLTV